LGPVRRIDRWLHAMPHPSFAVEIASTHVAGARWSRTGSSLESFASEEIASGAITPSPI
jgi:hypothetical protein